METCFICRRLKFSRLTLQAHVWIAHLVNGRCWCGYSEVSTFSRWVGHIDAEGGVEAHWLACQLDGSCGNNKK